MIEHANFRDHDRPGWHPLSGAPAHIRAAVNKRRSAAGLGPILGPEELRELERRIDAVRVDALARASGTGVWIDPQSRLAPKGVAPASNGYYPFGDLARSKSPPVLDRPTTYSTTVLLVVGHGLARGHGVPGTIGKRIDRNAYGSAAELNASPGWMLRHGHDGEMLAVRGPALRAVESDVVPLIARWTPDLNRAAHRDIVRRIEAGERGVSANYIAHERRTMRLPAPTDVVLRARLVHIAILPAGEEPAFPGAFATVYRHRPDTADELARQVAEVEKSARWRSSEAEWSGR